MQNSGRNWTDVYLGASVTPRRSLSLVDGVWAEVGQRVADGAAGVGGTGPHNHGDENARDALAVLTASYGSPVVPRTRWALFCEQSLIPAGECLSGWR